MCGITGVFSRRNPGTDYAELVQASLKTLKQRGPDHAGHLHVHGFTAGHARLSIIDVSEASHQPFCSADRRYTMVFNGEIFNFPELRKELEAAGHVFVSTGDTEVVMNAFRQYGIDCFSRFNGFFAIAIFDADEQKLVLARDRFGIKPLLYYADDEKVVFASEMKAMLAYGLPRELDEDSLYEYFRLTYVPEPFTMLKQIRKLPAAHLATITAGECTMTPYYHIAEASFSGSYAGACAQLQDLLADSVRRRLISDVPLGTFLSGGIDSSVVSALAARFNPAIQTFSIGFPEAPYYDETRYAAEVAAMHNLPHTVIPVSEKDFANALPAVLDYLDEPFADSSAIAVHVLSAFVRQHVTVALSGDGADEVFGGYRKHRALAMMAEASPLKRLLMKSGVLIPASGSRSNPVSDKLRQIRRLGMLASQQPEQRYLFLAAFHADREVQTLLSATNGSFQRLGKQLRLQQPLNMNDVLHNDVTLVLAGDMLRKADLMSMAASLEVRSPFLDYRIVDFAFSLPAEWKFGASFTKRIVSDAFADLLPERIRTRPKHGFEVPVGKWMNSVLLRQLQEEWFEPSFIQRQGVFSPAKVKQLLSMVEAGKAMQKQSLLWSLVVFQNWWKKYME